MSEFLGVMLRTQDIESGTHCNTRVYFACHPYIKFKIQSHTRTFFEPERIKNQVSLVLFRRKALQNQLFFFRTCTYLIFFRFRHYYIIMNNTQVLSRILHFNVSLNDSGSELNCMKVKHKRLSLSSSRQLLQTQSLSKH